MGKLGNDNFRYILCYTISWCIFFIPASLDVRKMRQKQGDDE